MRTGYTFQYIGKVAYTTKKGEIRYKKEKRQYYSESMTDTEHQRAMLKAEGLKVSEIKQCIY